MLWPRIYGQERVKQQLRELLRGGRLAHAYLFRGGEGWGKDAMAIQLAKVLHCESGTEEPCGSCPSCLQINRLQHSDVHFITALPLGKDEEKGDDPVEKLNAEDLKAVRDQIALKAEDPYHRIVIPRANVIKVNSIRSIRRQTALSTTGDRRRIVIISRAEEMNDESSNTLLKTLEEPPGRTLFILTTAYPDQLLATVRSRCHGIRFDPLSAEEIRHGFTARGIGADEQADLAAHLANGSFGRALGILREDITRERKEAVDFIRAALGGNVGKTLDRIEELHRMKDRDMVIRFLNLITLWFRDALVLRSGRPIINIDQRSDVQRFIDRFPETDFNEVLTITDSAVSLVERNGYIPLVLMKLSIQLRRVILRKIPVNATSDRPERTERRTD